MTAMTPDKAVAHEERMMGRPVKLRGFVVQHLTFDGSEHEVATALFDASLGKQMQLRFAVFIDGQCHTGGIVKVDLRRQS